MKEGPLNAEGVGSGEERGATVGDAPGGEGIAHARAARGGTDAYLAEGGPVLGRGMRDRQQGLRALIMAYLSAKLLFLWDTEFYSRKTHAFFGFTWQICGGLFDWSGTMV